mgnify:CR=1 FL=1
MAKTKRKEREKAGKRMKKKELVKALLDFFHVKQDEVLSLNTFSNNCISLHTR